MSNQGRSRAHSGTGQATAGNCPDPACMHLWALHSADGCSAKVYPAHSLDGLPCPCKRTPAQPPDLSEQDRPRVMAAIITDGNMVTVDLHCETPEMAEAYQRWLLTRRAIQAIHEEFGIWVDSGRPNR